MSTIGREHEEEERLALVSKFSAFIISPLGCSLARVRAKSIAMSLECYCFIAEPLKCTSINFKFGFWVSYVSSQSISHESLHYTAVTSFTINVSQLQFHVLAQPKLPRTFRHGEKNSFVIHVPGVRHIYILLNSPIIPWCRLLRICRCVTIEATGYIISS